MSWKCVIFTQDERLYLPLALRPVVEALGGRVLAIITAPPMETHGGALKGTLKHIRLFGLYGTLWMASHLFYAKLAALAKLQQPEKGDWSLKSLAERNNIPYHSMPRVNSDVTRALLTTYPADLLISVSCPQIIKPETLALFPQGGINVHSAPLPRYRGLMPAFWQLLHNEPETAVTVHRLDSAIDNGDILLQKTLPIEPDDSWDQLVRRTKSAAGEALLEAIDGLEANTITPKPNPESEGSYFSFPTVEDIRKFRRAGRKMVG